MKNQALIAPLYEEAEKQWVFSTFADQDTNNLFNFTRQITETTEKRGPKIDRIQCSLASPEVKDTGFKTLVSRCCAMYTAFPKLLNTCKAEPALKMIRCSKIFL